MLRLRLTMRNPMRTDWNFGKMQEQALATALITLSTREERRHSAPRDEKGEERWKRTADGTRIGSLSAVCRIFMQMRLDEVRNAANTSGKQPIGRLSSRA